MMDDRDGDDDALDRVARRVQDPDDYNRSRRFREIHDARDAVHRFVRSMELHSNPGARFNPDEGLRLARLVAMYVLELEPLMDDAEAAADDLLPEGTGFTSLRDFAAFGGMVPNGSDWQIPPPHISLRLFAAANRFYRAAGMDLELESDAGDAGFDYATILEDGPPGSGEAPQFEATVDGGEPAPDAEDADE